MNNSPQPNASNLQLYFAYFCIYVVWGSTYYFIALALKEIPVFLLGALRFSVAGLLLLGWCWYRKKPVFSKALIARSAVSGIVLLFIDMAVIMLAEQYVSSSLVAIISASTAIWILLMDVPMWKRNFKSLWVLLGTVFGFCGVALLYAEQHWISEAHPLQQKGILILFFGCISWTLGSLFTKYFSSKKENSGALAGAAWQMLVASLLFWIVSLFQGEIQTETFSSISWSSWSVLVYLILFGSLLAYTSYVWLLKVRPATEVGTHAYVNPFIAILLGVFLGGETVTMIQIVGLIVILISIRCIAQQKK